MPAQSILMYYPYTAVLGFGFLRRSTFCIHAVVRAVLPGRRTACTYCQDGMYAVFAGAKNSHEKITIFRDALKNKKNRRMMWKH
jgi:hypothetical protein